MAAVAVSWRAIPLSLPLPPLPHSAHRLLPFPFKNHPKPLPYPRLDPHNHRLTFAPRANGNGNGNSGGEGGVEKGEEETERRGGLRGLRWRDLLDPDPENVAAVGLTGLLAWASAQALAQIFYISLAILLAALKYSFIAALLLFVVITLL